MLRALIETYLIQSGFTKMTNGYWHHPHLGGRTFEDALSWWMATEQAKVRTTVSLSYGPHTAPHPVAPTSAPTTVIPTP